MPWLKPLLAFVALTVLITSVVGLWRYRQDIRQPIDRSAPPLRGRTT